jgi:hypothetical protein
VYFSQFLPESAAEALPLSHSRFLILVFFPLAKQPNSGLGRLIVEVSRSHTIRHTPGRTPLNE